LERNWSDVPFQVPQCDGTPSAKQDRAHRLQQHFERCHAESQAERAIAVVGVDPILARIQTHARGHLHGLMTRSTDLEEDPVLALQQHLAIVKPPRGQHHPIGLFQLLGGELLACQFDQIPV
jgi:hypothetical protein